MSLKSNFEYIRDWCNFRFLKKTDQVKVDLTNYATKSDLDSAGVWKNQNGVTYLKDDDSTDHGYGSGSVVEGYHCRANAQGSHAEGSNTTAGGNYSHAEGYDTQTYNDYEHASGQSNMPIATYVNNSYIKTTFTHGIGDSSDRKNAIAIFDNGDIYVYGVGDYNGKYPENSKSLQSVLGDFSDDPPVKLSNYKDDEEVIAAALNDLNSRIISLKADIDSLLITIVINGDTNNGDVTSYVNASTTEEQRFLLMNHLDTRIRIIDEDAGFDHMLHYGTYNGYTGYFGFHNGGPVRFYYDSANDKYIADWHVAQS